MNKQFYALSAIRYKGLKKGLTTFRIVLFKMAFREDGILVWKMNKGLKTIRVETPVTHFQGQTIRSLPAEIYEVLINTGIGMGIKYFWSLREGEIVSPGHVPSDTELLLLAQERDQ